MVSSSDLLSSAQQERLGALLNLPHVRPLLKIFNANGAVTRIVGGAVRNALLGFHIKDVDFATTLLPKEIMSYAHQASIKAIPTGFEHGTVTLVWGGIAFEMTTLRADVATDGRHAVVRFGTSFEEDALRRDFTMNALYLDDSGTLYDPVGGIADLCAQRVRFIGDPVKRIREDGLRIIRFFRFSAWYGRGQCDADGLSGSLKGRARFSSISRERVRSEFLRLLEAPYAYSVVQTMSDFGWLTLIFEGVTYPERFSRVLKKEPEIFSQKEWRLAALCLSGPWDVERLKRCLCLTRAEYGMLHVLGQWLACVHGASQPISSSLLCAWALRIGSFPLLRVALALEEPEMTSGAHELLSGWQASRIPFPTFPFSGEDVLKAGVKSGPKIKFFLDQLRDIWAEEWHQAWTDGLLHGLTSRRSYALERVLKSSS